MTPVVPAVVATILGAVLALVLSGSAAAAVTCVVVGCLVVALMYDGAVDGRIGTEALHAPITPQPAATAEAGDAGALVEALPEPALLLAGGRIAQANRPARAVLGSHVVGQDVRLAIRHPAVTQYLARVTADSPPAHLGLVGLGAPDQSWELTAAPLGPDRQLVLMSDRSARQAAERMRVDFVANASHELRTPLAGILGFIETLKDPDAGADADTRDRFLGIMEGEARRMQRLVEDLMSLSRIEADKFRTPDQLIDLAAIVHETADIFRQSADVRAHEIALDLLEPAPQIRGDRGQMAQLVHNLVSNALKYGRTGTTVTVALHLDGGALCLKVADEGDGIAAEHLPRLTERFYRVDSGRSRVLGGTGLGLAIVKHIVERHRGRLAIDSVVGRGTTVCVILPVPE